MKIIHIITGLNNGGAEAVLFRLIQHDTKNHHAVISMMDDGQYGEKLKSLGVAVHCLNLPRGKVKIAALLKLWNLIREQKPDVVQTWMYHADLIGGTIARLAGVKKVVWGIRHSNLSSTKTKLTTRVVARLCAAFSSIIPNKVVCCAQQAINVHQLIGYSKNRFVLIPNGYNLDKFSPDIDKRIHLRNVLGVSEEVALIGMVGRFDPQKDHQNLISALAKLKEEKNIFHCLLVGSNMESTNRQLALWIEQAQLQAHVTLLGQRDDVIEIMNALDLHVLSSCGEAFPNVLAEAMACGTPCVTTDVGDAAFIVGDTGWVSPLANSQALAQAIQTALIEYASNPTAWQARQKKARLQIIENFSIDRMVAAYNQVWSEV